LCGKLKKQPNFYPREGAIRSAFFTNKPMILEGIEHQNDFVPGASIPNRPAYRSNPKETKKLQRQLDELMEKGYIRETMSRVLYPCYCDIPRMTKGWDEWI